LWHKAVLRPTRLQDSGAGSPTATSVNVLLGGGGHDGDLGCSDGETAAQRADGGGHAGHRGQVGSSWAEHDLRQPFGCHTGVLVSAYTRFPEVAHA
jgi:hypothetical protein